MVRHSDPEEGSKSRAISLAVVGYFEFRR
jgi:hypothetical protein